MTNTLIARLRECWENGNASLEDEAADRIEALQARLTALEGQEPVATIKENPFTPEGISDDIGVYLPNGTKLYLAAGAAPTGINGLTYEETSNSMSVRGLSQAAPTKEQT